MGGWVGWGATKWRANAMLSLKTAKWHPLVPFSPPHVTQLNPWPVFLRHLPLGHMVLLPLDHMILLLNHMILRMTVIAIAVKMPAVHIIIQTMVNHSQLSPCQGKIGPLKVHPSTSGHQAGWKRSLSKSNCSTFGSITHMCCWSIDVAIKWQ